ncbi:MAG: L-fucose:H+ symporter permease [Bacteroidetes bacterium B1(2017)]|nr:MAG: L-fucose:H+ symporter permease [Bacteroidetes bacterium B1(2017)]
MALSSTETKWSFYAVVSLFFLWALAHNLNPILIPHLKKACQLSDMQSALVDSCFYIAYFFMALPAGFVIQKWGYQKTIVGGLVLFAIGALLFYPAAELLSYGFFLGALFIVASGLTFLETAANPYVSVLGDPCTATKRLNFAQSFNGLGATLAAMFGSKFILSGKVITAESTQGMSEIDLQTLLHQEAASVQMPYVFISALVFLVVLVFLRLPLPDIRTQENSTGFSLSRLLSYPHLRKALVAQFFYVGAQVGIGSFFIRYVLHQTSITDKEAAVYLSIALFLFMSGRFVGSWLMNYIAANKLLLIYCLANLGLLTYVILGSGMGAVYALMATQFFMSIMFPTIFSNGIQNLGNDARFASSLLVMTIVGGAFLPILMGAISDKFGIAIAFSVPFSCFVLIAIFQQDKPAQTT